MTQKLQNTLIIIGLIAVAGAGYYLFNQNRNISLNNDLVNNQIAVETAQFLRKLNELKLITLTGDIFVDNRFTTLVDNSSIIVPLPVGKKNPFVAN